VKKQILACLLTFAAGCGSWAEAQIITAKVTGGSVQGVLAGNIVSFKGIPFAAPPTGELRWHAPQPVVKWSGVKHADSFAPGCMQDPSIGVMLGAPPTVKEDCLYLNVWTPARIANERLPVMVWIYGGAFATGMTSIPLYDGTHLAQKGVIMVSIAYRVGPFGFLATPQLSSEGKGAGNYGLLDMIAALRWVKSNIEQFGGDTSRVTIFGESAGAIAVSMLAASPVAKGLFQRAISESGGYFQPPKFANEGGQNGMTLKLAEKQGIQFLSSMGTTDITAARTLSADLIQKETGAFRPLLAGLRRLCSAWRCVRGLPGEPIQRHTRADRYELRRRRAVRTARCDDGFIRHRGSRRLRQQGQRHPRRLSERYRCRGHDQQQKPLSGYRLRLADLGLGATPIAGQ
jgi:para-nitrobenzyl esterase